VKEWRSILSFHSLEIQGGGSEEQVWVDAELQQQEQVQSNDNSTKQTELHQLLHETSTKVFILIQMAMQTGPLVGSNPGYFKRCGGEVASVALEFLTHVIGLAEITAATAAAADDNDEAVDESSANVDAEQNDDNEVDSPDSDADSNNDDSSSSSSTDDDREGENDNTPIVASEISASPLSSSTQTKQIKVIQTLQSSFLFTEKQSQKVHQWHRNAQKAADTNKAPSKSASKLQGQKSKKQRQKDLKMERKLKKKSKGRGRK